MSKYEEVPKKVVKFENNPEKTQKKYYVGRVLSYVGGPKYPRGGLRWVWKGGRKVR